MPRITLSKTTTSKSMPPSANQRQHKPSAPGAQIRQKGKLELMMEAEKRKEVRNNKMTAVEKQTSRKRERERGLEDEGEEGEKGMILREIRVAVNEKEKRVGGKRSGNMVWVKSGSETEVKFMGEEEEIGDIDGKNIQKIQGMWGRWRICIGFVLSNFFFLSLAYLIATFLIPATWQWMGFILSYHVMLAGSYEIAMDMRDRWVRDMGDKAELEKWDFVVGKLERALDEFKGGRLVVEGERVWAEKFGEVGRAGGGDEEMASARAREAVREKLKRMGDAADRGLSIDRGLLMALVRE